jgi:RNA polymerase subunit RPABC4/transcription elongation factor Spt4
MTAARLRCRLRGYSERPTPATVEVLRLDPADRTRRALRHLAFSWGGAVVSLFIPVAHLLLVPGFFLAGIILLVGDLRTPELVKEARGTCPDCGNEQTLDLAGRWRGGGEVACRYCHRMLRVEPEPGGPAPS